MKIIKSQLLIVVAVLFSTGCASTRFSSVWVDKNFTQKPLTSIMVIGIMDNPRNRNIFEGEMTAVLEKKGVHAFASGNVLGGQEITKDNVLQAASKNHIQAVLVTRLIGTKKQEVYHPPIIHGIPGPYYRTWDGFYPHIHRFSYQPGYKATYTNVLLETNIYAVSDHKLIWSAASETFEPDDVNKEIKKLSDILVKKMADNKLVK